MRKTTIMYPQTTASALASDSSHSDSRYTVADILSSMANGVSTPSTLGNFEGFSTGVLTQTTPTLTPTTLRNIEQTFIELQTVPPQQTQHQNQAGFVTPIVNPPVHSGANNNVLTVSAPSSVSPPASTYHSMSTKSYSSESSSNSGSSPPWTGEIHSGAPTSGTTRKVTGRNMGGRRPAKHEKLSPEEEERRRVRRERNKLAAARCRKRRLDHTNCLVHETDILEGKRSELELEIRELNTQREELEFILETHKLVCKLQKHSHNHDSVHGNHQESSDVKPILSKLNITVSSSCAASSTTSVSSSSANTHGTFSIAAKQQPSMQTSYNMTAKPAQRPTTLKLTSTFLPPRPPSAVPTSTATSNSGHNCGKLSLTEETGIIITTPSNGIFNYDALMEGGTGLTPISSGTGLTPLIPTCSTQQRSSGSDLVTPDSITPTSKLVSL